MSVKLLTSLCLAFIMTGCFPVLKPFYESPRIEGTLLDAQTHLPITGLKVFHEKDSRLIVHTDLNGFFSLPSIYSIQDNPIVLGLPTDAYKINLHSENYRYCIKIVGAFRKDSEDTYNIGNLPLKTGSNPSCIKMEKTSKNRGE